MLHSLLRGPAQLCAAALLTACALAQAQEGPPPDGKDHGRPPGPPPEAVEACASQAEGATVGFTLKDGKTLTGTCTLIKGQLVAVPPRKTTSSGASR